VVDSGNQPSAQTVKYEARGDGPLVGSSGAKVTMVEFSDFECPFCQRFYKETYGSLKSKYIDSGKVKLQFRHFPLPFHANAQKAAEAGECASRQGKFAQYHDLMFSKAGTNVGLTLNDLKSYAQTVGLNVNNFNNCLDKGETASVISGDLAEGQKIGVSGTPGFLIFKGDAKDVQVDVALVNQKLQAGQNVIEFPSGATMIIGALPTAQFEQVIEAKLK
jgi:protein-disulfide isomerase